MNGRERFLKIAKGELAGEVFLPLDLNYAWFMDETLERWHHEGLPTGADLAEFFAQKTLAVLEIMKDHGRLLNAVEYLMKLFATKARDERSMNIVRQKLARELVDSLLDHAKREAELYASLINKDKAIEERMVEFFLASES